MGNTYRPRVPKSDQLCFIVLYSDRSNDSLVYSLKTRLEISLSGWHQLNYDFCLLLMLLWITVMKSRRRLLRWDCGLKLTEAMNAWPNRFAMLKRDASLSWELLV